jgi:hypothetical protein
MVDKQARLGGNVLGGSVYSGVLRSSGRLVAVAEWNFKTQNNSKRRSAALELHAVSDSSVV